MLRIEESGYYQISTEQIEVGGTGEVVMILQNDCQVKVINNEPLKLHIINRQAQEIKLSCEVSSELTVTLAALTANDLVCSLQADLIKEQARIKVIAAILNQSQANYDYQVNHRCKATYSQVDNYSICLTDSQYVCLVKGVINKGCQQSQAYQTTRVLTSGSIAKIKVLPVLEMAENQIKAKHACSIGRLSTEQQYYLASFGLDKQQVTRLIAKGYLSNILQEISDEGLRQDLAQQIMGKVDELCLM